MNDKLNSMAYKDVLNILSPRFPDDSKYMKCYNFWRLLQRYPYDDFYEEEQCE